MAEITESKNFIHAFIEEDIAPGGQFAGKTVHTRFPPEPNGYLHIGHCKALIIDFGTAEKFGGMCNLRMDDTNPTKEDVEFVEAIKEDIHWLGFDWGDRFFYGSDYFEKDYEYAVELIKKGLAYVCELTPEQFKEYRGDLNTPAVSPYRDRPIEESLDLFARMRAGEFEDNKYTLRAKIDLASGNFNMRDPVIYRIRHMHHHRQGDKWCIYPMYDFAHPIQDALEGITHSLCSLEFENHRPLYNWVVEHVSVPNHPRQIEFARLGIDHTVLSKRKLRALVENGYVSGWDDPRMPTLCGLRRRGYTPASIRNFCDRVGVAKSPNTIEFAFLEHCLREDLNETAKRVMTVLDPVKLTITNYPEGQSETFQVENNPNDAEAGKLDLARLAGHGNIVDHPVVERAVRLELQRAEGVRDALKRVLNGVGKIVHRVDAPLVALAVMVHIADAVDDRVTHIEVAAGKVDLRAQGTAALRELAVLHALEKVEVLLHITVTVGGHGGLADVAAVLSRLLGRQVADIGKALFDQLDRVLVVLFKVIAAVEEAVAPVKAQPMDVLLDGVDELDILLGGVRIVHAEIAQSAEALGSAEVNGQRLAVADVQIAVRLRRESGVDLLTLEAATLRNILFDKGVNKVLAFALGDGGLDFLSHTESFLSSCLPAASKNNV